jgi:transposase
MKLWWRAPWPPARLPLAVVNPRQIRDFARAIGQFAKTLAKTDELDVAVLAHFAEALRPEPRPVADEEALQFGELVARRRQLIEMMTAERNRRRQLVSQHLINALDHHNEYSLVTVISIQPQVAHGHVGNSAALFALQLLGIEVAAVPTVLFSNHRRYPSVRGKVLDAAVVRDLLAGVEESAGSSTIVKF